MKSNTRLDSIVFQLTPTRTRCDLVITANGKTEKIASGLLNPFLAHLKAAQDQIGKGGYSIILEPKQGSEAPWFTKGTVERFVRFVSTPEILERVYTIESEILQIEKAISVQNSCETGVHTQVEDIAAKSEDNIEGSKPALGGNEEKAIVLYQPVSDQQEDDDSNMQEKNSKVQLVRVLETRKTVLQKEQGMAFARAAAASFDVDNISALLSFAECFGASRMMDACKRFVELWKAKHESGQWVEVEATEAMSCRSDLPINASGIMFLSPNEQGEVASEKAGVSCEMGADVKPRADHQGQLNPQEYSPGQLPHPMFAPWQMHPQANGMPLFQPYPMQGMPYYPHYPGNSPFLQSPYTPVDESRSHSNQRTRQRRHSMDSRDLSADFEAQEVDVETDEEDSASHRTRKKGGKSSKKQSGTVVIRNINYIAASKEGGSDSDAESCSGSGSDDEEENVRFDETGKSKKKVYSKSNDARKSSRKEEIASGQAGDDGHWQAFQNFLLIDADESSNSAKSNMFAMEGKVQGRKRASAVGDASSVLGGRNMGESHDVGFGEQHDIRGDMTCMRKPTEDGMLSYGREATAGSADGRIDLELAEAGGRRGSYRRGADASMNYMINRPEKLTDVWDSSLDPVISSGFQGSSNNNNKGLSHGVSDESVMIMHRSGSLDHVSGNGRTAVDMNYELPFALQKEESHTVGTKRQSNYEPNLMPDRAVEDGPSGYAPALEYELQAQAKEAAKQSEKKKLVTTNAKEGPRKGLKDQKLKAQKGMASSTKREKPSKLSPSEDARARAERLRAFKADLQKLKKEKEEEQLKRLEALKMERQKRIAARSGANPAQSPLSTPQARKQLPKLSPVSQKGSKFSDTEPGSSSPLQRSTLKMVSRVSSDSDKAPKSGRLNAGHRLTRSASSLSVRKGENNNNTPETKATMARIRRLSEPKSTLAKTRSVEAVSRQRVSEGPEMKRSPVTANLEKAKSAIPPESKLRASKASSVSSQKRTTSKEMLQKPNEKMLSPASANSRGNAKAVPRSDVDDNTVVEKTVVMLECEKPSIPIKHESEDMTRVQTTQPDAYNPSVKSEDDVAIPPPASPITVKEIDRESSEGQVKGQFDTHLRETGAVYTEKVLPDVDNNGTTEKPYQAPYARVSSLEDPCMVKSNYGKAPPTSLEMAAASVETTTIHVSDGQRQNIVKISEVVSEKQQGKESSKGFRRLLKFGKKGSAASGSNVESDKASLDGSVADDSALNGSSSEVFTLKNLLTQEESSSAGTTPKKSSRSFSILSPFKSKNSGKKLST